MLFDLVMLTKITGVRPYYGQMLAKPTICSVVMGVGCVLTYKLLSIIFGNTISTLGSIAVGMIIYLVTMLLINGITARDFNSIPKGKSMVRFFRKIGLMK